ncbi:MAG TPA: glycosyltransferase family 4 protein [Polyangiaceae bacterium]|nr:glycosyltransferase family 4 protein [Polyangiaceae bacterium]
MQTLPGGESGPPRDRADRPVLGRVLCVTSNFPRWAGDSTTPFVLHLCRDLVELGWQVDVLAPHAPGAAEQEWLDDVRVERFHYAWPESAQTVCYQGGALVNLRKRPLEKLKLPALVFAEWAAVQSRLLQGEYDLVHSHWILPQGFVGSVAGRLANVPHVVTVHGGDLFALRGALLSKLKRWTLEAADAVTVNSSFTEGRVRELSPGAALVERIPMGVNDRVLSPAERQAAAQLREEHAQAEGPLLIFVGRLVDEKGPADAIDALELLRGDLPGAKLWIVGSGQDEEALRVRCEARGLSECVRFVGWVAPESIRTYLHAADVFLGPSRTAVDGWVEAQGLTFLEAMAAEVPVVATRSGGIVDAVVHEESGLLVDENSPAQLADAVRRLVKEPGLAERVVRGGLARLGEGFSRTASAARFSELFERVIRERRDPTSTGRGRREPPGSSRPTAQRPTAQRQ